MAHSLRADVILLGQIWLEPGFYLPLTALVGVLALGAWIISRVRNWQQQSKQDPLQQPLDLLGQYEKMVADGSLDPEELARIKASISKAADPLPKTDEPPPNPPTDFPASKE